ncbi:MAG: NYN domain-containing protein [Mesorhizobium sp.]|nr:MAG: NYN domain-containing protein [Mesorhizobium sp.]
MSDRQSPNVAVLIDTENVSAGYADRLFDQIASIGCATVRRGYGDFTGLWSAAWARAFERHAITPRQQFSAGRGKNSADIALVIDAMDLLNQGAIVCDLPCVWRQRFYASCPQDPRTRRSALWIWQRQIT